MTMFNENGSYKDLVVDKENHEVIYNDEKHLYIGKNGLGKNQRYISATQIIEKFHDKFDGEFWSKYKALEAILGVNDFKPLKTKLLAKKIWSDSYLDGINKLLFESKVQEVLDAWALKNKTACDYGTKIHLEQEELLYNKPKEIVTKYGIGGTILPIYKNKNEILNYESGIFPELLISYTSEDGILKIAGQADLIIKNGNHIKVLDWKTNEKLEFKSFFDSKTKKSQSMHYPINNLMDCNGIHYQIQLSIYAYLLQKLNPEFIIDELRIIHFQHDGQVKEYVLEYIPNDIERMLSFYKKQLEHDEFKRSNTKMIF